MILRRLLLIGTTIATLLTLAACGDDGSNDTAGAEPHEQVGRDDDHGPDEHDPETDGGDGEGPRVLHLEGVRGVAFATVEPPREEGSWFAAEAIPEESSVAMLTAPVTGFVVAFHATPGSIVASGDPVVDLRSPELGDLYGALLAARARATRAEAELERERRLLQAAATAQRDVEAAIADAAVARADAEAARLALTARGVDPDEPSERVSVRAARQGTLESLTVALGEGVTAGAPLGRISAGAATRVRVELPLPGPAEWRPGVATEVRASDGRRWQARVEGMPAALDHETRRLGYRLRLENADPPLAGTPLEVRVPFARAIVLPQSALQQVEGTWGVFVREGDEVRFQAVRRGAELGGDVLVLGGVEPGQVVATEGGYLLKSLYLKLSGGGEAAHEH
jgi:cobalt-zinc-cadmium efflux system membrane fusion protein